MQFIGKFSIICDIRASLYAFLVTQLFNVHFNEFDQAAL